MLQQRLLSQPLRLTIAGKVRVDLHALRSALAEATIDHQYFLDTETGDVMLVSEMFDDEEALRQLAEIDAAEPDRYLQVPHANSRQGYDDIRDFIDTVSDERLEELLRVAIQGRGAFRRFKDVLARHAERQRWFDFQAARLDGRARAWLAEEGCEPA